MADSGYSRIRRVTAAGVVTTVAGTKGTRGSIDGVGENALFGELTGLVVDAAGVVYIADAGNYRIPQDHAGRNGYNTGRAVPTGSRTAPATLLSSLTPSAISPWMEPADSTLPTAAESAT